VGSGYEQVHPARDDSEKARWRRRQTYNLAVEQARAVCLVCVSAMLQLYGVLGTCGISAIISVVLLDATLRRTIGQSCAFYGVIERLIALRQALGLRAGSLGYEQ